MFSADPRLSALTTYGSSMGLPASYYRILKLVQEPQLSSGASTVTSADDMVRWIRG